MRELDFKPIGLPDRPVFEEIFARCQPGISEYTFTNLYVWSTSRGFRYVRHEEGLIISAEFEGRRYFMPPVGYEDCEKTFAFLLEYGPVHGIREMHGVPEYQKKYVNSSKCKIIQDRKNHDYIYKTESLSSLRGWRLDGKRGFVKKFRENYDYEYRVYDPGLKGACLDLAEKWARTKIEHDPSIQYEIDALEAFLKQSAVLPVRGGVLLVEGQVVAFSFGERLNDTTFVVHFEKADPVFIGSFQMINQQFIQHEAEGKYLFVNREQDMGIEGIRKAKLSYVPVRILKKYLLQF